MVALSMSEFFKKRSIKLSQEITPGIFPYCDLTTSFISIVYDRYKCMHCGEEVEQKVNGVIKYLPIGKEILVEKDNGTT